MLAVVSAPFTPVAEFAPSIPGAPPGAAAPEASFFWSVEHALTSKAPAIKAVIRYLDILTPRAAVASMLQILLHSRFCVQPDRLGERDLRPVEHAINQPV